MSCRSTWLAAASASGLEEDGRQDLRELRAVIEQATGMLMATFRCGPGEAPELLRRASRDGGVKVHVLAAKVGVQASRAVSITRSSRAQGIAASLARLCRARRG